MADEKEKIEQYSSRYKELFEGLETAKKNNLNYVELFNNEDINLFLINLQNIKNEKFK